ncbi:Uncharacterized protein HZ326_20944 [Fusarium oxysporum f. sp. albedinis]|nr:Uncharacterized protein HZ326_20944 [Fusarium oxysporum f. sp. albedinis]
MMYGLQSKKGGARKWEKQGTCFNRHSPTGLCVFFLAAQVVKKKKPAKPNERKLFPLSTAGFGHVRNEEDLGKDLHELTA